MYLCSSLKAIYMVCVAQNSQTLRLAKVTEISKLCGEKWRAVSEDEKKKFEDMAKADRERYAAQMKEFEETGSYTKTEAEVFPPPDVPSSSADFFNFK